MALRTFDGHRRGLDRPDRFMAVLTIPGSHDARAPPAPEGLELGASTSVEAEDAVSGHRVGGERGRPVTAAMEATLTTWPSSPEARIKGTNVRTPVDHTPQVDVDHPPPLLEGYLP